MIDKERKLVTRDQVLQEMDVRRLSTGKKKLYTITFIGKNGKRYFLPKAYSCGAGKMDNKRWRLRGVQPCDCKGNPEGHVYPVGIFNIIAFNGYKVVPSNYFDKDNGHTIQ